MSEYALVDDREHQYRQTCTCHDLELSVLKPSVSRPLVVCCKSLCHVFEHEHRVIELRDEMWYVNKIRVKWVQLLKVCILELNHTFMLCDT